MFWEVRETFEKPLGLSSSRSNKLHCAESTVVFPANQKAESAQQPITAEFVLVPFVSAMILPGIRYNQQVK